MISLQEVLRFSTRLLAFFAWTSALLFGLYILSFFIISLLKGQPENWNYALPGLYDSQNKTSSFGIGLHFIAGGLILVFGCLQLIEKIRIKLPGMHRWIGRIYVVSSILASAGGLLYIFFKGTIGGLPMDIGFGLYGILMFIAAIATWKFALQSDFDKHRVWALRLFALAIGSWLYRMEFGFFRIFFGKTGHNNHFNGFLDIFLDFFFYLPNLLFVELYVRGKLKFKNPFIMGIVLLLVWACCILIFVGTFFFAKRLWIEQIMSMFK